MPPGPLLKVKGSERRSVEEEGRASTGLRTGGETMAGMDGVIDGGGEEQCGGPRDPETEHRGVGWLLRWLPDLIKVYRLRYRLLLILQHSLHAH